MNKSSDCSPVSMDLGPSGVIYEKRGHLAYITLNRPQVLNAMDLRMHAALQRVWDDFEKDDSLWLAVLTGAGERSFSVGQDLKELVERNRNGSPVSSLGSQGAPGWPRLTERHEMTKPVIARVNGYALGGGFELVLACDIIIAAESATFALPEAKLGLIPGAGGVFRLTRMIPSKVAMGLLMTGRNLDATRAYELGLVSEVVPDQQLDDCIQRWVTDVLACGPLAIRAIKQVAYQSAHMPLATAFETRFDAEEVRRNSRDCREGPLAFVEKRAPEWIGA